MNKTAQRILILGIALLLLMAGILGWVWKQLPPQIPWYYSLPSGEQQLVDKSILIWVLLGGLVLMIMTRTLALWAGKKDVTVETTITLGGLIAILLLAATFSKVVLIFIGL